MYLTHKQVLQVCWNSLFFPKIMCIRKLHNPQEISVSLRNNLPPHGSLPGSLLWTWLQRQSTRLKILKNFKVHVTVNLCILNSLQRWHLLWADYVKRFLLFFLNHCGISFFPFHYMVYCTFLWDTENIICLLCSMPKFR